DTHLNTCAVAMDTQISGELSRLEDVETLEGSIRGAALDQAAAAIDRAQAPGASRNTRRVIVNPGVVRGGVKVNMVAAECTFEIDIRVPNGLDAAQVHAEIDKILARYPEPSVRQIN